MSHNHKPLTHLPEDAHHRPISRSLEEDRNNKPNVQDCVAAALRFEHQLEKWLDKNPRAKVSHAFVGAVAVSALTEEYMRINDPNAPLGKQRIARDTKDVDLDLNYHDPAGLWEGIGGKYVGRYDPDYVELPGGHSEGCFVMRGESHLWEATSPWKGNVPFDVHSSNFRLDSYFGRPNITFNRDFGATRSVVVKNSFGDPAGSLIIYCAPLLLLLKLDAHPRAAHPIHKDLRDIRLLVEGWSDHNKTLKPRAENPFELDREQFRRWLDQLTPEWWNVFHAKAKRLVDGGRIAQEVAVWELEAEQVKPENSRKSYTVDPKPMAKRYYSAFKFLLERIEWCQHELTFQQRKAAWDAQQALAAQGSARQQRSLAKAGPYDPYPSFSLSHCVVGVFFRGVKLGIQVEGGREEKSL